MANARETPPHFSRAHPCPGAAFDGRPAGHGRAASTADSSLICAIACSGAFVL